MLGAALVKGKPQTLKLNKNRNTLSGEVDVFLDASILNRYPIEKKENDLDFIPTHVIPAKLQVEVTLLKPLRTNINEFESSKGSIQIQLNSNAYNLGVDKCPPLKLIQKAPIEVEIDFSLSKYKLERSLCVQPVFIRIFRIDRDFGFKNYNFGRMVIDQSGRGLTFGTPKLVSQWEKVDISFDIKKPKIINDFSGIYTSVTETEIPSLLDKVDDDYCIEVFFIRNFDPVDKYGGGATWGSGTASAKIISSDAIANGIDFNHLAHEMGHVLGLGHPWSSARPNVAVASTGTLLCGSGFRNDNPDFNSRENGRKLGNILLRYSFTHQLNSVTNCLNSEDCGPCR